MEIKILNQRKTSWIYCLLSVTDGIIFFWSTTEEVWLLILCLKTSSEVMFDRRKLPSLLLWQQNLFSSNFFLSKWCCSIKCCKLLETWFFGANYIFCTFDKSPLYLFPWTCLFITFLPRASDSQRGCLKTGARENKGRTAGPKTQKVMLGQNLGHGRMDPK